MKTIVRTVRGPIECRIEGQGAAILTLNGGHTNCDSPLGSGRFFLENGYQLVIPSRPGYGATPSASGKSAEEFADTLVLLLDKLQIDQAIVLGISAAGRTALQFAGRHPERVSKLILQNALTGGKFPGRSTRIGAYLLFNPWLERGVWAGFRSFARLAPDAALTAMMGSLTTLDPKVVVAGMSPAQRRAALEFLLASRSGSGFMHDLQHRCGDLRRIKAPTLIIESKYDGSKDGSHATYAADYIPNAALFISPAESHLLWFSSCNDAIENKMLEFLQSPPHVA